MSQKHVVNVWHQAEFDAIERHHIAALKEANGTPPMEGPRSPGARVGSAGGGAGGARGAGSLNGFGGFGAKSLPVAGGSLTIHRGEGVACGSLRLVCPDGPSLVAARVRVWVELDDLSFLAWRLADAAPSLFIKVTNGRPGGCTAAITSLNSLTPTKLILPRQRKCSTSSVMFLLTVEAIPIRWTTS